MKMLHPEIFHRQSGKRRVPGQQLKPNHANRVDICRTCRMLRSPPLRCGVGWRKRELLRVRCRRRLGVTRDTEVCQAPVTTKIQDVGGLEIPMHNSAVQVDESLGDVLKYGQRLVCRKRTIRLVETSLQRLSRPRHDEDPEALVLPSVDDRNDVPNIPQSHEQQLTVRTRSLRHELGHGVGSLLARCQVDLPKSTAVELRTNCPLLQELHSHAIHAASELTDRIAWPIRTQLARRERLWRGRPGSSGRLYGTPY